MAGRRLCKVTYSLPEELIDRVRWAVKAGAAPSYSAFVEQALSDLVRRAHEEQLQAAFASAGTDPDFLADINRAMHRFDASDDSAERGEP